MSQKSKRSKSTGGKAPRKQLSTWTIRMARQQNQQSVERSQPIRRAAKIRETPRVVPQRKQRKQLSYMSEERKAELEQIQAEMDRLYRQERNIPLSEDEEIQQEAPKDEPILRLERVKVPKNALKQKPLRRSERIANRKSKQ